MATAFQQCPSLPGPAEADWAPGQHPRAAHPCAHRDGEAQTLHTSLYSGLTQERDNSSVIQSLSLGVQVPGAAQHGFQLILQPSTHSRGKHTAEERL